MDELRDKSIYHNRYGEGKIIEIERGKNSQNAYLIVLFESIDKIKEFSFPSALGEYLFWDPSDIYVPKNKLKKSDSYAKFFRSSQSSAKKSLESQKENAIEKLLKRRKIRNLIHFTRLENLESILDKGLVPIDEHLKRGIKAVCNDAERLDLKPNCTSLSVEFPNYKLFYKFRKSSEKTRWVVIQVDPKVLLGKDREKYFCFTNAARVLPPVIDDRSLSWVSSFEKMFSNRIIGGDPIKDSYPTDPQAEILISGIIEPSFFKGIFFYSEDDLVWFTENYNEVKLKQVPYSVSQEYFKPRSDYVFWQKGDSLWQDVNAFL